MLKKIGIIFITLLIVSSCARQGSEQTGRDLTLSTQIAINDLPDISPIELKQTQMFSGNVLRSVVKTGITIGGEVQELSSITIINLEERNIYFVNDGDSTYVRMTFASFDSLMTSLNQPTDSTAPPLTLSKKEVNKKPPLDSSIGVYRKCIPVEFDLVLDADQATTPGAFKSELKGTMWLSDSIANVQLFANFRKKSLELFKNSVAANAGFSSLAGIANLDENWIKELNNAITGIPVKAEFKVMVPVGAETVAYNIALNLENFSTANIDPALLKIPAGYKEVNFSEFRTY